MNHPKYNKKIRGFGDFVKYFKVFINQTVRYMPITKTGFIGSRFCTPLVSGLAINLAEADHNIDDFKETWVEDLNFDLFAETAKKYGFFVDRNAPWRIVANVGSPQMQRYWLRAKITKEGSVISAPKIEEIPANCWPGSGSPGADLGFHIIPPEAIEMMDPRSVKDFFKKYYAPTYLFDIKEMKKNLVDFYNAFVISSPSVKVYKTQNCSNYVFSRVSKLSAEVIVRNPVTLEQAEALYGDYFWMNLYYDVRLAEISDKTSINKIEKSKYDRVMRDAKRIYQFIDKKVLDNGHAMGYINEAVKGFLSLDTRVDPYKYYSGQLFPWSVPYTQAELSEFAQQEMPISSIEGLGGY